MYTQEQSAIRISQLLGEYLWEYDMEKDELTEYGNIFTEKSGSILKNFTSYSNTNNCIYPEDKELYDLFCNELKNGRRSMRLELRIKNDLGNYIWVRVHGTTIRNDNNQVIKIIGKIEPVDSYDSKHPEISNQSSSASLETSIEDLLDEKNDDTPYGFILMSLDSNLEIRKTYGDAFCDTIMEEALLRMRSTLGDSLCEWIEDDMFAILFPIVQDEDDLVNLAMHSKRLAGAIYTGSSLTNITFSIGMTLIRSLDTPYETMRKKADLGLLTARNSGPDSWDMYGYSSKKITDRIEGNTSKKESFQYQLTNTFSLFQSALMVLEQKEISEKAFEGLLQSICQKFKGNFSYVAQYNIYKQNYGIMHQWRAPDVRGNAHLLTDFSLEVMDEYDSFFDENGVFLCKDLSVLSKKVPLLKETISIVGIKSFISFALKEEAKIIGHLSIGFSNGLPELRSRDIGAFILLGQIMQLIVNHNRLHTLQMNDSCDSVTGLYNLTTFIKEANFILNQNTNDCYALVYSDINKFKGYNTNYGFTIGNQILKKYASYLSQSLNKNEIVSRIEKDHFVSLIKYHDVVELTNRLKTNRSNEINEDFYRFESVYGIYLIKPEDSDVTNLIDKANVARKSLKGFSGTHCSIYNEKMAKHEPITSDLESELGRAFKQREFVSYFQTQYGIDDLKPVSAEVLIRWNHPSGNVLLPNEFLPFTSEKNIGAQLDFLMLRFGCRHIRKRLDHGHPVLPLNFNLSAALIMNTSFLKELKKIPAKYQIPANYISFEITEKIFVDYPEQTKFFISEIHPLGYKIILDDFGNTYSSFNLLRDVEIDGIKLDTGFVHQKLENKKDRIIFAKIIEIAKELGLIVYSEGVETLAQYNFLQETGCDIIQGFLYSKPLVTESYESYILDKL